MADSHVFQADSFVDSVGVNIHSWYGVTDPDNAYNSSWVGLLADLGVRHVREAFIGTDQRRIAQQTNALQLASMGIDILYTLDAAGLVNNLALLDTFLASDIPLPGAVEPWNEYDIKPGYQTGTPPQWIKDIKQFQPQFYAAIKARWPDIPVLTSAVSNNITVPQVGSLLPYADAANIHLYGPPAVTPEFASLFAPSKIDGYANQAPNKPIWVTETGLITGLMSATNLKTSELAAARLVPRTLLYMWAPRGQASILSAPAPDTRGGLGVSRSYLYELLDEHDSADSTLGIGDRHGLFYSDSSPKKVATALGNLLHLLADKGASFIPTPLTVTASGVGAERFEYISFQKRDGSYWVAFWMGLDVTTDPIGAGGQGSGPDLPDTVTPITLQFDRAFQRSSLFRPMVGAQPIQQSGALGTITVPARLDVQLLQLQGNVRMGTRARGMRSYYDSRPNSLG